MSEGLCVTLLPPYSKTDTSVRIASSNLARSTKKMYNISQLNHIKYGNVIEISRQEVGEYPTPFNVINKALTMRRLWMEKDKIKVKFLIDNQVLTVKQIEHWANEEYKSLPKCQACGQILNGNVYTHKLCGSHLFCSQACADQDHLIKVEKINDEEECDYL